MLSYIDIFAGCGGLSLGMHNAGWNSLFAIEKNADAFNTFKHNLIDKSENISWASWLPVSNHDINDIISLYSPNLQELSGKISLVAGGPPCQGFSMAGQRDKNDVRNKLVESYIQFVQIIMPELVFFENVQGITIGFIDDNKNKAIPSSTRIIEKLKTLGYQVSFKVIDMFDYGVPQRRKRFILVGSLTKNPEYFFRQLELGRNGFLTQKGLPLNSTVADAIGDLLAKNCQVNCPDSNGFKSGTYGEVQSAYQKYLRTGTECICSPDSHRFAKHKETTISLYRQMLEKCEKGKRLSPKSTNLKDFKKRGITILNENMPCNTITSHPDDYLHFSEPRIMTVRECARIQSFPDTFEFKGKYTTGGVLRKIDVPRHTQVGNAIPPLFAEQAGLALKELLYNA